MGEASFVLFDLAPVGFLAFPKGWRASAWEATYACNLVTDLAAAAHPDEARPPPAGPLRRGAGRDLPGTTGACTQPLRATGRPLARSSREGSKETATRALRASQGGSCEVLERAGCSSPLPATPALTTSKEPARPWGKAEESSLVSCASKVTDP